MIANSHKNKTIHEFNFDSTQTDYEILDLNKALAHLTLTDLDWCLRRRKFLDPAIEIILDIIEENWNVIDRHFSTSICEWYDEIVKNLITLPFSFWDNKHITFYKLHSYIVNSIKRELSIEKKQLQLFVDYKPQPVYWTKADNEEFKYYISFDILGNILQAEQMLIKLKYAILNQQNVFIESEFKTINSEEQLIDYIKEEYSSTDNDYYIQEISQNIKAIQKIEFVPLLS